jgi:sortase A
VTRRHRLAFGLALAMVTATAATTAVVLNRDDDRAGAADNPVFQTTSTTTTTLAPTTTVSAPLPVPDPPPEDPYDDVPIVEIGSMSIPRIGIDHTIYEGIWLTVLDEGPGHWPNSALPGQRGNTVFPGHRVTNSHPFRDVDQLAPGDQVVFHMPDADHTYAVRETIIVEPTDLWVVDQTETPTFTLVACHPKGSARERIVVKGDLVATTPRSPA